MHISPLSRSDIVEMGILAHDRKYRRKKGRGIERKKKKPSLYIAIVASVPLLGPTLIAHRQRGSSRDKLILPAVFEKLLDIVNEIRGL